MSFYPEAIANHIENWLSDYAKNAGVDGFVVGVSGGIDSAVTATLCARTTLRRHWSICLYTKHKPSLTDQTN